ncbi:hypothetical protein [Mesorhizobium captivum]|uniref:hypothetical protein n=1 Tax=Mesorhizobium captivum TaxID=3072319 RepID=UPI002A246E69|nr:hypothetical protein [Mesorhizobium sp. VK3C]MDX8448302.1 hypothetical protein [Mesorhizobium sp. VK3C]
MHRLHIFKQVVEAYGVIGWQPLIIQICNQLMLAAKVPLAFLNMPPGHFDIVHERH